MPKIPQYFSDYTSPGISGSVPTPPNVVMPKIAPSVERSGGIGEGLFSLGQVLAKRAAEMREENEKAHATAIVADFKGFTRKEVLGAQEITGEAAISVGENKGVTFDYTQKLKEARDEFLGRFSGSPKLRNILTAALDSEIDGSLVQISNHENNQRHLYKTRAVDAIYNSAQVAIKSGGDVESAIKNVENAINVNFPGNDNLKLYYRSKLEEEGVIQKRKDDITNAIVDLKIKHAGDLVEALAEAESPEFIKKYGEEKQRIVVASLASAWRRSEDAYTVASNEIKGKALQKIMKDMPVTDEDVQGLRPADVAVVWSWQKSRTTELRQEARWEQQQKQIEAQEKRAVRAEERYEWAQRRQKLLDEKETAKSRSTEIMEDIVTRLSGGEEFGPFKLMEYTKTGLSTADKNKVEGYIKDIENQPAFKDGLKLINDFARNKGFSRNKNENSQAQVAVITQLRKEIYSGKLQGAEIPKRAEQILEPYKVSFISKFFNNIFSSPDIPEDVQERMDRFERGELLTGGGENTVIIDGKAYKDGDIITKNGKQFRVKVK
uniref:Uncharacterized protein n=1 Tax=viral metagenome TaxID=1070528 RepID=A0A6M3KGA0_9ZZZZ